MFLDTLAAAREELMRAVPPEYLDAENELLRRISDQQTRLRLERLDEAARTAARAAIDAAEDDLRALRLRLAADHPALANARYQKVWPAAELAAGVLGPDETLLMYFAGRRTSFAWFVRKDGTAMVHLPPRLEIEQAVSAHLQWLKTPASAGHTPPAALSDRLVPDIVRHVPPGSRL